MNGRGQLLIFGILLSFLQVGLSQPFTCQANKYLTIRQSSLSTMYEIVIDPFTGAATFEPLSAPTVGFNLNAIGYRSVDNYIYGLDVVTNELIRIDATGAGTGLGFIQGLSAQYGYYGADCTADGKYLVLIGLDDNSEVLVRVNLENLNAGAELINLQSSTNFVSTDIAFHPINGLLYGFDAISNRMFSIDPETGVVDLTKYPTTNLCDGLGAVFFDSFGTFYGYGNDLGASDSRTLFKADISDGILEVVAQGPTARGKDACSCPYTVELQKAVLPKVAFPCTVVDYVFTLSNISGNIQTGIQLLDMLPAGISYYSGPVDLFGGELLSQPGDNSFQLINMEIPPGIHEIAIKAYVEEGAVGFLRNQAVLLGLPDNLGGDKLSDDPTTTPNEDSTTLQVIPLSVDLQFDTIVLCQEEEIILEASTFGAEYLWQDGSVESSFSVTGPGIYEVTVSTDCDVAIDNVVVLEQEFLLIEAPVESMELGSTMLLQPNIIGNTNYTVQWTAPADNSLSCLDCESPFANPTDDITYFFEVFPNGSDCTLKGDLKLEVEKFRDLYIPNVFSPNNDGVNDTWEIFGKQPFKIIELAVYSRWGEKVFGWEDQAEFLKSHKLWEGRLSDKPMQPAVFVWKGKFEFLDGFQVEKAGDLTLLK